MNTKEGSQCVCVRIILIDSIYIKDKSYHPQVFLGKRIANFNGDIEVFSDDSYNKDSDKEY